MLLIQYDKTRILTGLTLVSLPLAVMAAAMRLARL